MKMKIIHKFKNYKCKINSNINHNIFSIIFYAKINYKWILIKGM